MRHGRKSETERVDGCKRCVARGLDRDPPLAARVLAANAPGAQRADKLRPRATAYGEASTLDVDRALLASTWVRDLARIQGDAVVCRPFVGSNRGLFTKRDLTIDLAARTVRRPAGQLAVFQGDKVHLPNPTCRDCSQRTQCQKPDARQRRPLTIRTNEPLLRHLIVQSETVDGGPRLRDRVPVAHALAHQRRRRQRFARDRGAVKNDFDAQRVAAVNSLQTIEPRLRSAQTCWRRRRRAESTTTTPRGVLEHRAMEAARRAGRRAR